jgi:hypothetical protein
MVTWKKAVVIGSVTAGALLLIKGHRGPGAALATVGMVVLASEYPEQFEQLWDNAPDYISRGSEIFSTIQRIAERFADEARRDVSGVLREVRTGYR